MPPRKTATAVASATPNVSADELKRYYREMF